MALSLSVPDSPGLLDDDAEERRAARRRLALTSARVPGRGAKTRTPPRRRHDPRGSRFPRIAGERRIGDGDDQDRGQKAGESTCGSETIAIGSPIAASSYRRSTSARNNDLIPTGLRRPHGHNIEV